MSSDTTVQFGNRRTVTLSKLETWNVYGFILSLILEKSSKQIAPRLWGDVANAVEDRAVLILRQGEVFKTSQYTQFLSLNSCDTIYSLLVSDGVFSNV